MEAEAAPSAKIKEPGFFYNFDATIVVAVLLAIGFAVAWATVGRGEALRGFAAEAVILAVTFAVARQWLPWEDAPRERVKRPKTELTIGLIAYAAWLIGAVMLFSGGRASLWLALGTLLPIGVMAWGRYGAVGWGLRISRAGDWLLVAVMSLAVFGMSRLLDLWLPSRELFEPAGAALLPYSIGGNVLLSRLIFIVLVEFFFRVFLQPRLAAFLPGRWAVVAQAALYSAAYLPLYLIGNSYPLPYAIALTLVLSNGILAGYLYRKTGSLPLLILLHLFAFPRYGL